MVRADARVIWSVRTQESLSKASGHRGEDLRGAMRSAGPKLMACDDCTAVAATERTSRPLLRRLALQKQVFSAPTVWLTRPGQSPSGVRLSGDVTIAGHTVLVSVHSD